MIKVSILYPNQPQARFDWDYYINTHMPMSIGALSAHPLFRSVSVERGAGAAVPGEAPAYIAMCIYAFESLDGFMDAFLPHAEKLQGDMANYTDIAPVIQFNEVLISK